MSLIENRLGGNATTLPVGALSRRAAMFGAVTIASFGASFAKPAAASIAIVGAVSPISADAPLIDLANRVEALAIRERQAWSRVSTVEDAVGAATPPAPKRLETRTQPIVNTAMADGARLVTFTAPAGWDEERLACDAAYKAALADHARIKEAVAARLGLPEVEKLAFRMSTRLHRWTARLVDMQPVTAVGVGAKAAALLALAGDDCRSRHNAFGQHDALVLSVLRDVAAIGERRAA